jgi:multiple sugar transport system substrate-binding protein
MWGRLLRLYGPPGSENNHWYEASSIFSQGKAAMYTDANSLFPVIEDPQKSKVVGKVGYALFPRGPKGQYGSTVAVWGLGIPKTSKNQKAAWLFMQWATGKEQVLKLQSERGILGCRESVWKDPKGRTKVPGDLAESLMEGSKVGTPFWNPPVVAVAEVRDAIGAAIVTSIQGGDVRTAVQKAAVEVKRIMAETEK